MQKLIVTRHRNLVSFLIGKGLAEADTPVLAHVDEEDITDMHVIGVLPLSLACKTALYTEVPLRIPYDKKGKEITAEEIAYHAGKIKTYKIEEVQDHE